MTGIITHKILLTREKRRQAILLTGDGVPKDPVRCRHVQEEEGRMTPTLPPGDLARCTHPPSIECYAIQAFSIPSNFDPKLIPEEQNQITMRKVCTVIQSLLSRRPNYHSSYFYFDK